MTKTSNNTKKLWLPEHALTYTNGEPRWQVRYQLHCKRTSELFKTKAEAETAAADGTAAATERYWQCRRLPKRLRHVAFSVSRHVDDVSA